MGDTARRACQVFIYRKAQVTKKRRKSREKQIPVELNSLIFTTMLVSTVLTLIRIISNSKILSPAYG